MLSVRTSPRSTSATLQACATQPRGVNGASASKISLIEPMQRVAQVVRRARSSRRPSAASGRPDGPLSQASTKGPMSQAHTVPW